MKRNVNVT